MASKLVLDGGIALVTGAASGLGQETAYAFAEAGVKGVVFADANEQGAKDSAEASKQYARNSGYKAIAVHVDITDEASVDAMVRMTLAEFGRIDYSVNSAGLGNLSGAITPNLKVDVFMKTMDTNVKGTMLCNRAVTQVMAAQDPLTYTGRHGTRDLGRGSIVNVGSVNSYVVAPGMVPYCTSKHALVGLTKAAAIDNLQSYIRINGVCPSWIDTPMNQASLKRIPMLGEVIKRVSPLGRAASTEEVADYIVFLCSPSASYINGSHLIIDAGISLTAHTA